MANQKNLYLALACYKNYWYFKDVRKRPSKREALKRAIKNVGTQREFAEQLAKKTKKKCSQQKLSLWLKHGVPVKPYNWVFPISELGQVPKHEIAPEIYPND